MAFRKKITPSSGKITPLGECKQDQESKNFLDLDTFISSPRKRSPKIDEDTRSNPFQQKSSHLSPNLKLKSPEKELSVSPCRSEASSQKNESLNENSINLPMKFEGPYCFKKNKLQKKINSL